MFDSTHHTLKLLAAIVWYIGVVVLSIKSTGLLIDAHHAGQPMIWQFTAVLAGVLIGWIKAKYLFKKICIKNLIRITSLERPMLWQFYRRRFFVFLFAMIWTGNYLSTIGQGIVLLLSGLATLEISIAVALALSSRCFWDKNIPGLNSN